MRKIILSIIIILLAAFYVGIFALKEKRMDEMCRQYKKSENKECCTLKCYDYDTLEDFNAAYQEEQY